MSQRLQVVEEQRRIAVLGAPLRRFEDAKLLTGSGKFVDDMKMPGMLYAAFLRSPYAHARIDTIDVSKALNCPGVVLVLTGKDLLGHLKNLPTAGSDNEKKDSPRPVLPSEEANHIGEALAVVVAEDPYVARDAIELIEAEYKPLEVVEDPEAALKFGSPRVHDYLPDNIAYHTIYERGEVDRVFREADKVVECQLINQRVAPVPLEARGVIASYDPGNELLTVWLSTQHPHGLRTTIAQILALPENRVRVIAPDMGGGFGAKAFPYPEEMAVAYASLLLNRPVKWVETRSENLLSMIHGRGQKQFVRAAISGEGRLLGLNIKIISDGGAYCTPVGWSQPYSTALLAPGAYDIGVYRFEIFHVYTNKVPQDAYRGAGAPEANYLIERIMDIIADKLRLDPVKIRSLNFIDKTQFPFQTVSGLTYDSGDYERNLRRALELASYEKLRAEQKIGKQNGRLIGIGVASWVDITGMGSDVPQTAAVTVTDTGKVIVTIGGQPHGQGEATSAAQIASQVLGVDPSEIVVNYGDTALLPWSFVTGGSSFSSGTGSAVYLTAMKIKDKMSKIAAKILEVEDFRLTFSDGKIYSSSGVSASFDDVARASYQPRKLPDGMEPTLYEYTAFVPRGNVFPFGTHIAMVEVEKETGLVKLLKYYALDDCGKVINPLIAEGQVHGGVMQGLGQALVEEVVYDEQGQLLTSTFADYQVPSADLKLDIVCDRTETPTSFNPLGVKGIGEGPTMAGTSVVVNAVNDALSDYNVVIERMPLKPEFVRDLLNK